jgi:hypothetical protein
MIPVPKFFGVCWTRIRDGKNLSRKEDNPCILAENCQTYRRCKKLAASQSAGRMLTWQKISACFYMQLMQQTFHEFESRKKDHQVYVRRHCGSGLVPIRVFGSISKFRCRKAKLGDLMAFSKQKARKLSQGFTNILHFYNTFFP